MIWQDIDELERFKVEIDLRVIAMNRFGYEIDRYASGKHSTVMRNQAGDKVVIRVNPRDRHFEYFSVRDDGDRGSVIDFVQRRVHPRPNLGEVRKDLRGFMGWLRQHEAEVWSYPKFESVAADLDAVEQIYSGMKVVEFHPYLVRERRIPPAILRSKRFRGRVRMDARGNAVFPHFGKEGGLCGYEIKNRDFKSFSSGGVKGLWLSNQWPDPYQAQLDPGDPCLLHNGDFDIVFAESAIDALSHSALFTVFHRRYASIGGRPSDAQLELVKDAIRAMQPLGFGAPPGRVVAAMDSDSAGAELCELIASAWRESGRTDLSFVKHVPDAAKDWNEVLCAHPNVSEFVSDTEFSIRMADAEYAIRTAWNAAEAVRKERKI